MGRVADIFKKLGRVEGNSRLAVLMRENAYFIAEKDSHRKSPDEYYTDARRWVAILIKSTIPRERKPSRFPGEYGYQPSCEYAIKPEDVAEMSPFSLMIDKRGPFLRFERGDVVAPDPFYVDFSWKEENLSFPE